MGASESEWERERERDQSQSAIQGRPCEAAKLVPRKPESVGRSFDSLNSFDSINSINSFVCSFIEDGEILFSEF